MESNQEIRQLLDHLFRKEYGKVVSFLTNSFGFRYLESAEDIAQETLIEAFKNWSYNGIPENPEAWIFRVARNKAINFVKREQTERKVQEHLIDSLLDISDSTSEDFDLQIKDSMMRMMLICCRCQTSPENQITFILKTLCGFSRKEIASALLINEETVKKRLYRVKKAFQEFNPEEYGHLKITHESELDVVYTCLYLLFNEGYNSMHTDELIRKDLCLDAARLTKLLVELSEEHVTARALFALMCFHIARFDSRLDQEGAIVLFRDQDRSNWNQQLIQTGLYYLTSSNKGERLSSYHLEASIAAQHCLAKDFQNTNWSALFDLYSHLYKIKPSPVILLNQSIITGFLKGPLAAIESLEKLIEKEAYFERYHLFYATLGEFYLESKDQNQALSCFHKALDLASSKSEKELLRSKIERISS